MQLDPTNFKKWLRFYNTLRKSLRIRYAESVDFSQYEQRMQNLLDTYIGTEGEVVQLSATVNMFSDEFKDEVNNLTSDRAKADAIVNATTKYAKEKREKNPAFYDKIAERIKEIIQKYKDHRLSEREFLSEAKAVQSKVQQHNNAILASYPTQINSIPKQSFYDSIKEYMPAISEEKYITSITFIDVLFKSYIKKPNWKNNLDVKNQIEQELDDYIFDEQINISALEDFLEKTYELAINNYE